MAKAMMGRYRFDVLRKKDDLLRADKGESRLGVMV